MTYQNEREEIIAIAKMLIDGENIYYMLGTARALKRIEEEEEQAKQQTE